MFNGVLSFTFRSRLHRLLLIRQHVLDSLGWTEEPDIDLETKRRLLDGLSVQPVYVTKHKTCYYAACKYFLVLTTRPTLPLPPPPPTHTYTHAHTHIGPRPRWLSWMRRLTGDQKVAGSTPAEVGNILSWRLIMKYFLRSFSPFR